VREIKIGSGGRGLRAALRAAQRGAKFKPRCHSADRNRSTEGGKQQSREWKQRRYEKEGAQEQEPKSASSADECARIPVVCFCFSFAASCATFVVMTANTTVVGSQVLFEPVQRFFGLYEWDHLNEERIQNFKFEVGTRKNGSRTPAAANTPPNLWCMLLAIVIHHHQARLPSPVRSGWHSAWRGMWVSSNCCRDGSQLGSRSSSPR
jgi:hypothetical protein